MNLKATQLKDFFSRAKRPYIILPQKPYDYVVHLSLCIHRTIQTAVLDSVIKTMFIKNPKFNVSNAMGDALIDRARSREASDFLRTDAEVLLMCDDDIQFDPMDAVKICNEARETKSVVCAAYVIKKENQSWITCKPLENSPPIIFEPNAPLVEVKFAGTGFVAIYRSVLEEMIRDLELPLLHPTDLRFYPLFLPLIYTHKNGDKMELSEDWSFSFRCSQIGRKIWLDPSIRLTHWGVYGFTLDDLARPDRVYHERISYEDDSEKILIPKDEGKQVKLG